MTPTKINFKNIPVQAGVISKIISLDVDANNCFQELEDLISSDQGVASLLLRVQSRQQNCHHTLLHQPAGL
jgi:HD-like signal output (HDOD) protein